MTTTTRKTSTKAKRPTATPEAQIRERLEGFVQAARDSNLDQIMSYYAPEIVSFDAIATLKFEGTTAYRKHWQECIEACPGPMIFEIHELRVIVSGDGAFCHYITRCGYTADGKESTSWMRATAGWRQVKGTWMIVHEHYSAPFDPQSSQALLDLKP